MEVCWCRRGLFCVALGSGPLSGNWPGYYCCFEAEMQMKDTAQAAPPIRFSVFRPATVSGTQTADGSFRAVESKPNLHRGTGQVRGYIVFLEHVFSAVVTRKDRVLITACT